MSVFLKFLNNRQKCDRRAYKKQLGRASTHLCTSLYALDISLWD